MAKVKPWELPEDYSAEILLKAREIAYSKGREAIRRDDLAAAEEALGKRLDPAPTSG